MVKGVLLPSLHQQMGAIIKQRSLIVNMIAVKNFHNEYIPLKKIFSLLFYVRICKNLFINDDYYIHIYMKKNGSVLIFSKTVIFDLLWTQIPLN